MDAEAKNKLIGISTATIATILYKKGLRNQVIQAVVPVGEAKKMVGEAFTLRYIPAREDLNPITVFRDTNHPQRQAVENCPEGAVMVIDSRNDPRAASAGSILVTRLMKRGAAGIVTDGGLRDSASIGKLELPAFHQRQSAPTNLTLHQALEYDVPIGCGGVAVFPGDIAVGDEDGVIIIPKHLVSEVIEEGEGMELFEMFVEEKVNEGRPIIGLYPPTDPAVEEEYSEWKKKRTE